MDEKQKFLDENLMLKEKLKTYESIMNSDLKKIMQLLFKELNCCTVDLDELVKNCVDIYSGKQVNLNSLLGSKTISSSN
jgi:hypothetical protein